MHNTYLTRLAPNETSAPSSTRAAFFLAAITLCGSVASAQFVITSFTIDGGGGNSAGGSFALVGSIGQPDAGPTLAGGTFLLAGGFFGSPTPPRCIADFDDGSGTGTPDGGVTIDDLLYYLDLFAQGVPSADIDDGSATGAPDGGVTIDDLLYFLQRFSDGC